MLVLTRRIGEQIVVPDLNLTLTIVGIENNKVRLGFAAPADVEIFREEVWQRIGAKSLEGARHD